MIIAISGTPATGKSTVAKLLAKKLGCKYIDLNRIAEKKNLYAGYDSKRGVKIVDIDLIENEIKTMKVDLVLDSHYSHEIENDLTVILRTNPRELRERMKKKNWPEKKIEENVQAEIMEICKAEAFELGRKVLEIDTTKKTPEEAVEEILDRLKP